MDVRTICLVSLTTSNATGHEIEAQFEAGRGGGIVGA